MIRYGSVCSGIEAASVAVHPLGWQASWFAEIEPFPSAALAHHYPDVPNLGDMTKIAARVLSEEIDAPDVLVGGTPCQAFSVAGLRNGLADARGALTISFVELADAIDTARFVRGDDAAVIWWENVPGVLSSKDNAFGCFLGALAGESCELQPPGGKWPNAGCVFGPKRTIAWRVLDAQYFGVAQRRRRVFVVASARNGFDPAEVLFEFDGLRRDTAPSREAGEGSAAGTLRSTDGGSDVDHAKAGHILPITMAHGQGGAEIGFDRGPTLTCNHEAPIAVYQAQCVTGDITHTLKAEGFDASEDGTGRGQPIIAFSCKDHGGDAGPISPTLRSMGHDGNHANAGGQVAVAFDWKMGEKARSVAINEEQSPTLGAQADRYAVQIAMQVRRLTPRECERLQGFPDDYTNIPWTEYQRIQRRSAKAGTSYEAELRKRGKELRGKPVGECPDGPRYKALGNSMAVPNMRWIGRRIDAALRALSGSKSTPAFIKEGV